VDSRKPPELEIVITEAARKLSDKVLVIVWSKNIIEQ